MHRHGREEEGSKEDKHENGNIPLFQKKMSQQNVLGLGLEFERGGQRHLNGSEVGQVKAKVDWAGNVGVGVGSDATQTRVSTSAGVEKHCQFCNKTS